MKFILAICLLFFYIKGSAQTTFELLDNTMQLFEKGEYEKTIIAAEKAAEAVKKEFGENHILYGGPIFFLAICHFNLFHFEKAETYFLKQKESLSKTTGEEDKSFEACLIKQ